MGTSLLTDPSNNIIILGKLKKKIKEFNTIKNNITNLLLYVLVFFILLVEAHKNMREDLQNRLLQRKKRT